MASSPTESDPPPAYELESTSSPDQILYNIRNTKYSSEFVTNGQPSEEDYQAHIRHLKDSFIECGAGAARPTTGESCIVNVQSKQAFGNIEQLICAYQRLLETIDPLDEEDIIFLLLSRFSRSTGTSVYVEIKRPSGVQIFDSTMVEPSYTSPIRDYMVCTPSVVTAEFHVPPSNNISPEVLHVSDNRQPSTAEFGCSVTINFPEMSTAVPVSNLTSSTNADCHPTHNYDPSENDMLHPVTDWGSLPAKLQPPAFRVHRCHHRGMERGGEQEAFELPFGFPEVIQHVQNIPHNYYHIGFYVRNKTCQSLPYNEGGSREKGTRLHTVAIETKSFGRKPMRTTNIALVVQVLRDWI
ncbi:uncharacterized protein SETTUDRAFT_31388 [Exserohilum turcica Et28A]|uniref:Uncharacterized protein n=1 Tax=Exserohilum turcicum (strain 28A) TaxID=671987 RepID=R0KGB9_EXST2|nr:uncharacterized protein SETTUDRAFT_31388 [Exserohilum turcica Et28A]EOA87087.1 hypothetical protein SETTUDRAFT_31388 [Exserohilum turcica Et28A]